VRSTCCGGGKGRHYAEPRRSSGALIYLKAGYVCSYGGRGLDGHLNPLQAEAGAGLSCDQVRLETAAA
jgi:hypothetical protein